MDENISSIVKGARLGEQHSWNEIDRIFRPKIYAFCKNWFKNSSDAEEATQEVFLQCYRKLNQLSDDSKFESWLYSIARNKCSDLTDKKKRTPVEIGNSEDDGVIPASVTNKADEDIYSNPEMNYEINEEYGLLLSLLDTIPDEQKFCFIQRVLLDKPFKEIAELAGISESTAKSRYRYAKKAMRSVVSDYEKKTKQRLHRGLYIFPVYLFRKPIGKKGAVAFFAGEFATTKMIAIVASVLLGTAVATAGTALLINMPFSSHKNTPTANTQKNTEQSNTNGNGNLADKIATIDEAVKESTDASENNSVKENSNNREIKTDSTSPVFEWEEISYSTENLTESAVVTIDSTTQTEVSTNISATKISPTSNTTVKNTTVTKTSTTTQTTTVTTTTVAEKKLYTYNILDDDTLEITGYTGTEKSLDLPNEIGGHLVSALGEEAFKGSDINTISLPDTLKVIGMSAFVNSSITEISIPDNITEIDAFAFSGCKALKKVHLPNNLTKISTSLFAYDSALDEINIPSKITSIGDYAFQDCSSIKDLTIPNTCEYIEASAFKGCCGLDVLDFSNADIKLYSQCFSDCTKLKTIENTDNISEISNYTFSNCTSLENISLTGITAIPENCLLNCTALNEITLSSKLIDVEKGVFSTCQQLADVYFDGTNSDWHKINIEEENEPLLNANIHFLKTDNIADYEYTVLENNTIEITGYNGTEKHLTLPGSIDNKNVTSIGENAFLQKEIETIILPDNLKIINANAFTKSALCEIIIPDSVTDILDWAFYKCSNLEKIKLPKNLEKLSTGILSDCEKLTEIDIPKTVWEISGHVFQNCSGLKSVKIPDGCTYIGMFAFDCNYNLEEVYLPNNPIELHTGTFSTCEKLKSVINTDNISHLEYGEFAGTDLEFISLKNVTEIPKNNFSCCKNLKSITLSNKLTSINDGAFRECNNLTDIYFYGTSEEWLNIDINTDNNEALQNATIHCSDSILS